MKHGFHSRLSEEEISRMREMRDKGRYELKELSAIFKMSISRVSVICSEKVKQPEK
jgi:hypothetical protein